ncbi:MAG: GH32 C-terminal domain-containing protein, partial [Armatimonadota bacterium]|nr:GH32 C-terminal domain-containing protein [Armatimonadota bacterium]
VEGRAGERRWVVYAADGAYALGDFDGRRFLADSGKHRFNWGNAFYAAQTFNDVPPADGRRIQISWCRAAIPGMPFNQMMNFPVELTLRPTEEGLRLFAWPVREIRSLYRAEHAWSALRVREGQNPLTGLRGNLFDVEAEIAVGDAAEVGFWLLGVPVVYRAPEEQLHAGPCVAPLKQMDGRVRLRVLVDRTSREVFANGGRCYMPVAVITPGEAQGLETIVRGGSAWFTSLVVRELYPAWE